MIILWHHFLGGIAACFNNLESIFFVYLKFPIFSARFKWKVLHISGPKYGVAKRHPENSGNRSYSIGVIL